MLIIMGEMQNNANAASGVYAERYPQRRRPNANVFRRLEQRARETGNLMPQVVELGRPRTVRTPEMEEQVIDMIEHNPTRSTRSIAQELGVNHSLVWNVLHSAQFHPFHYTRVHSLLPDDFERRTNYCNWLLQQVEEHPNFTSRIMWTDEANFSRDGFFNQRNSHYYSLENPHVVYERNHQYRFSVNVWAGIMGTRLIGPVFLPHRLNAEHFMHFLENDFQNFLDDIPLAQLNNMWLQLDGAPAHNAAPVRIRLDEQFPGRWIGRAGPVLWPARSPDLTPLDTFFWGHVKSIVYRTPVQNVQDLINRIRAAAQTVDENMLHRVQNNIIRRAQQCLEVQGQNFEHLLL